MNIGIDARFFGPKDKGYGRYTKQLIGNLEKADRENQYFVFLRKNSWEEYKPENPNFKKVLADYKWYGWKEQIFLPIQLKKHKLDLVHFTHFNVPILYSAPWFSFKRNFQRKRKFIVTIHDLTLRHFSTRKKSLKNLFFYPFKNLAYRIVLRHAIKNSKRIIAISEHTKKDILKHYKVNPDKIKVIYDGVQENFKFKTFLSARQVLNPGLSPNLKSQIKKPYLLYVGNAYPHKNLKRLILAFEKLVEDNLDYQLILVGGDDYFYKRLKLKIKNCLFVDKAGKSETKDRISLPGFVSDKELDSLYRNATLYIFPSLCEGFGLPALEAMIRKLPVISSNFTCLPEILGKAVLYFNPLDVNDIAQTIKKALLNESLRKNLIEKGLKQIEKYNWRKTAKETLDLYKTII